MIQKNYKKLIDKINDFSNKDIKNNFEVSVIIESAFESGNTDTFKDLIFKAKYINGLKSVLSNRIVIGDDFMEKIFNEFNKNLQLFSELLKEVLISVDIDTSKHFSNKYFELNQESIVNSLDLIEDLTICKEYFNDNKYDLDN
jgi:hypothetical protein